MSSSGGRTDGCTDLLGRFKTLVFSLLKWFYYNLPRELCVFANFYKSITDRRTDGRTDRLTDRRKDRPSYRDARTHLKVKEDVMFAVYQPWWWWWSELKNQNLWTSWSLLVKATITWHSSILFARSTSLLLLNPSCNRFDVFLLTNEESFKFASERNRNFRDSKSNN